MKKVLAGFIPGKRTQKEHYSKVIGIVDGREYSLKVCGSVAENLKSGFLRRVDESKPKKI